jgi:hypothetical protein
MVLNLFNLDLHISVIADFEYILKRLFPFDFKINAKSMSGHASFIQKNICNEYIINRNNWRSLSPDLCELFYQKHKEELEQYDGFIVTHTPSFSLLYEKFNKKIIIINSCRYEQPASHNGDLQQWEWINEGLKRLNAKKLLINVSNNLFDKLYLKNGTGIDSVHIPSLCLYTSVDYNMINKNKMQFLLYSSLKNEFKSLIKLDNPNILDINSIKPYNYIDLIKAKGIIHIPYEMSTMSIFEQYSMNIPLIFPSKELLIKLHKFKMINFYGSYVELFQTKIVPKNLEKLLGNGWLEKNIKCSDFYDKENMPFITYFDSFQDLPVILNSTDFNEISKKMSEFNMKRRLRVFQSWSRILIDSFNLGSPNMYPLDKSLDKIITTDRLMENINSLKLPELIQYYKTDFLLNNGIWRNKKIDAYSMDSDILVNGHSDYEINNIIAYILSLRKQPKLIYSINSNTVAKNCLGLPLGITNDCEDSSSHKIFGNLEMMKEVYNISKEKENLNNRSNLVLLNINKTTHPERSIVFDKFSKESYVTLSLPDISMEGRKKYLLDITLHEFVLCPRGNGIDTHRLWETLYMERIPIVIYSDAHASFIGLPILFINNWDEINEKFLREKLIEIKSKSWMWDKVYLDYWLNLIPKHNN